MDGRANALETLSLRNAEEMKKGLLDLHALEAGSWHATNIRIKQTYKMLRMTFPLCANFALTYSSTYQYM